MNFIKKYLLYILSSALVVMGGWNINMQMELGKMRVMKSNLAKKNKALLTQQKQSAKRFAKHKANKSKQLLSRAKKKIASAPAKVVPLLGVAAIITMTSADVYDYCRDLKDMNALEKELFERVSENNTTAQIEAICNLDIPAHLKPKLQSQYDQLIHTISNRYDASILWIKDAFYAPFGFFESNQSQATP